MQHITTVTLFTTDGRYVRVEPSHRVLLAQPGLPDAHANFELLLVGGGTQVALRALDNGQFVVAEGGGHQPLFANRGALGPWETFELIPVENNLIALRAISGPFVGVEGYGQTQHPTPLVARWPGPDPAARFALTGGVKRLLASLEENKNLVKNIQGLHINIQALQREKQGLQDLVQQREAAMQAQQQAHQVALEKMQAITINDTKTEMIALIQEAKDLAAQAQTQAAAKEKDLQKLQTQNQQDAQNLQTLIQVTDAADAADAAAVAAQVAADAATKLAQESKVSAEAAIAADPESQAAIAAKTSSRQALTHANTAREQAKLAETANGVARDRVTTVRTLIEQNKLPEAQTAASEAVKASQDAQDAATQAEQARNDTDIAAQQAAAKAGQAAQTYDNWQSISALFGLADPTAVPTPTPGAGGPEPTPAPGPMAEVATDNWHAISTLFGLVDSTPTPAAPQTPGPGSNLPPPGDPAVEPQAPQPAIR